MNNAMVSVVVPIYNVEQYLLKCVDSILEQTYGNIQVILVDDGSPDNCGRIIDEYAMKDSRVIAIHKKNGGISSARNEGLKYVKGDYLTFCDSDDWLDLNMYEMMVTALEKYNGDVVTANSSLKFDRIIVQNILQEYLLAGDVNVNNKMFRYKPEFKDYRFPSGDVAIDIKGCFDFFKVAKKWVQIPGAYYNFRQDNISYGRSGFSPNDINAVKMTEMVSKEAKEISDEIYKCARYHVLHSKFDMINKVAIFGYKKPEFEDIYQQYRKEYVNDIRKNIFSILKTRYFSKGEKIQLLLLAFSYPLFMKAKSIYSSRYTITNKAAIKC